MAVSILIPTPLRRFTGGARSVQVEASTVGEALAALAEANPDLRTQVFDDAGQVRTFVNIFLGDDNVRNLAPGGEPIPVKDGDVLTLVPAIAGGSAGVSGVGGRYRGRRGRAVERRDPPLQPPPDHARGHPGGAAAPQAGARAVHRGRWPRVSA